MPPHNYTRRRGLNTSIVTVTVGGSKAAPVTGYGFSPIGRFAQSGLIAERFGPRLLAASSAEFCDESGSLDPGVRVQGYV